MLQKRSQTERDHPLPSQVSWGITLTDVTRTYCEYSGAAFALAVPLVRVAVAFALSAIGVVEVMLVVW